MRPQIVQAQRQDLSHLAGTVTKAHTADPAAPTMTTANTGNTANTANTGNSGKGGSGVNTANTGKPAPAKNASPGKVKLSVYVPIDIVERARSAWRQEAAQPGVQMLSWSEWVSGAIEEALIRSEREHNGGRHYPPTPAGVSPVGRKPQL